MDIISFNEASTANGRIESFIENPDSTSGVLTVPKTIAAGETITIPAGRVAILPDLQVDGDLVVDGDLFIPTGSMTSQVVQKVTSTDNAVVRFDGTTGQVQNSAITIDDSGNIGSGAQSFNGFGGSGFKNYIINPKFKVNQYNRLPYVAASANSVYIDGNWRCGNSGTGTLTLSEDTITYLGTTYKAIKVTATTAITLPTAARYFAFGQNLEANNISEISNKNMCLSFLFECSRAGKYSVVLAKLDSSNGLAQKTYITSFTAIVGVQQVIIPIPADSYQVLNSSNSGIGVHIGFVTSYSTFISSVDGWVDGPKHMKSDSLAWGDTTGAYIKVTDVVLEQGLIKTPSESRPYGLELSLCQRYYQTDLRSGYTYTLSGTTSAWRTTIPLMQSMRVPPTSFGFEGTIYFQGNTGGNILGSVGTVYNQKNCIQFDGSFTANNASVTGVEPMLANGGYFWASAEL